MLKLGTAAVLLAGLFAAGCTGSDDGGGSDAGTNSGGGVGSLLDNFGRNGEGAGADGDAGPQSGGAVVPGGPSSDCLTTCGLLLACANSACGGGIPDTCATECSGSAQTFPIAAGADCATIAAALGIGSFSDVCTQVEPPPSGGGGGGGSDEPCCTLISCSVACGQDQNCIVGCATDYCGGTPDEACSTRAQQCGDVFSSGVCGGASNGNEGAGGGTSTSTGISPEACCDYIACAQGCAGDATCGQNCLAAACPGNDVQCLSALSQSCLSPEIASTCGG